MRFYFCAICFVRFFFCAIYFYAVYEFQRCWHYYTVVMFSISVHLYIVRRCSPLGALFEGFDTFSENDLSEMIEDETVNDSDIINNLIDYEDGQEEPDSMTTDTIYAGIQLSNKLEKHFLKIDTNSERSLKFQNELRSCISGYRDVYKQLIKRPSSQKLITDFMVPKK